MKKTISIGAQDYEGLRERDNFYIDKTCFIKEWWESDDVVTLITRPRRFGKTLNMSMLNCFFSNEYAGRGDLFAGLSIWEDEKFRTMQGTYPVIFLSFAGIKETNFRDARKSLILRISTVLNKYDAMMWEDCFTDKDRNIFYSVNCEMDDSMAAYALNRLCEWLSRYYKKKCIVLLDEYDTPLQEAYIHGYWEELTGFIRTLFNNTFKTNPSLERAIMTGITRVSKESIFSDLNNLNVVTTTSNEYASAFGFTEEEVFAAMDSQEMPESDKAKVKEWYDGFTFGGVRDIYNPWSITSYLDRGEFGIHWANTSSNGLVGHLLQSGTPEIKMSFEELLNGGLVSAKIDEQIVFDQIDRNVDAVWSLLLAAGYLKVVEKESFLGARYIGHPFYTMKLTNLEVRVMFENLIDGWFAQNNALNGFVKSMLSGNVLDMNRYMNDVALTTFSAFDGGSAPSDKAPERFYHGFVLGLLVENIKDYFVRSNRESGYGRYDVVLEPKDKAKVAVIMEFKVIARDENEKNLEDTVQNALRQIEEKRYDAELINNGIAQENILKYALAFEGKKCLIVKG